MSEQRDIVRELREDYPAVDVTSVVFGQGFAGVGCCVIPQDRVTAIADEIASLRAQLITQAGEIASLKIGECHHFECMAEKDEDIAGLRAQLASARKALEPFAADKMPSLQKSRIAYNRDGLRCAMSPMEIACQAARVALKTAEGKS